MEKEKKKGAVTSEERNREANANPVEEALRKQWKAACTHARMHVCTHEGKQAQHGKGATSRGQAAGTGSKRGRVPPGKGEARPRQRGLRVLTTELPPNSIVTSCFPLRSNKILFQDVIEKVKILTRLIIHFVTCIWIINLLDVIIFVKNKFRYIYANTKRNLTDLFLLTLIKLSKVSLKVNKN